MLAGNDTIHESFDEFEIQTDLIRDHRVSCSWASKKSMLPFFLISQLWLYLRNSQVSIYMTIGPLVQSWGHNEKNGLLKRNAYTFVNLVWPCQKYILVHLSRRLDHQVSLKYTHAPASVRRPSTVFKHFRIFIIISAVAVGSSLARENMRDKPSSACGPFSLGITRLPRSTQWWLTWLKMSDGRKTNIPNNQKKKLLSSSPFNAKIQNVIKFLF